MSYVDLTVENTIDGDAVVDSVAVVGGVTAVVGAATVDDITAVAG